MLAIPAHDAPVKTGNSRVVHFANSYHKLIEAYTRTVRHYETARKYETLRELAQLADEERHRELLELIAAEQRRLHSR